MTTTQDELLAEAAERAAGCTLSMPHMPVSLIRRSRVLFVDETGVWLAASENDFPIVEQLIQSETPIHVTLRSEEADALFQAVPTAVRATFLAPDKRIVSAILLRRPEKISTSQRRKTFRVPMVAEDGVTLRLWRINEYVLVRDRPLASQEIRCEPKDLGEGGVGAILFSNSKEALNLKHNQRFRAEVKCGRHEMLFEARLRHPEQSQRDDESVVCGFSFIHNDRDVESRRHQQKLQLVLSEVQRNSVKRGLV